jgi:hypothetical protein
VNPLLRVPLSPFGLVTLTVTAPADRAGVVAVIVVALVTLTLTAATPPNATVAPIKNFVPVIVTEVPPAIDPEAGATLETVGAVFTYVNALDRDPLWPSRFVTFTVTAPVPRAGVVAVRVVLLITFTLVAVVPPKVTVAPAAKKVPVIVTVVPPIVDPEAGDTLATVGEVFT